MANSAQSKKRARQADKRNARLTPQRTAMRTSIKKLLKAIADKEKDSAKNLLKEVYSRLDTLARKNVLHAKKASRIKSRLTKRVKDAS